MQIKDSFLTEGWRCRLHSQMDKEVIYHKNSNLLDVFLDRLSALEILFLLNDLKPLVRLCVKGKYLKPMKKFCDSQKLYMESNDNYKLVKVLDINKNYSNKSVFVPLRYKIKDTYWLEENYLVYISKKKNLCKKASDFEVKQKGELGLLLGYPECCCRFFEDNFVKAARKNVDFVLLALSRFRQFQFYNNICLHPFGVSLLSHFVCSFECKQSLYLAKRNLNFLKRFCPGIFDIFITSLKSFVVYTEYQGIHYTPDYSLKGRRIRYSRFSSTSDTKLKQELEDAGELTIRNFNHFILRDREFKSEDIGFLVFN